MWFREFPVGFYYAGYAHEGSAWLTLALALATAILSVVFRGSLLRDPRLPALRRLAWSWSIENFLLAAAVYNRLFICINFNGLTAIRLADDVLLRQLRQRSASWSDYRDPARRNATRQRFHDYAWRWY